MYNCDCLEFLRHTDRRWRTIFADPPDNIGLDYIGFVDKIYDYPGWLEELIKLSLEKSDVFWLSFNQRHDKLVKSLLPENYKQIIWRYKFGQYREDTEASGYRPIVRVTKPGIKLDFDSIRIESDRMKMNDKRAKGVRVPDDVWDFPRALAVRSWHPTRHPEALIERIVLLSGGPVLDLFLGSGTTAIVCEKLGIPWEGCEISSFYFSMISEIIEKLKAAL